MASTFITSCTPGSSASALGKKVDDPATALDVGVAALVVRDDALTTLAVADGDYTQLRVSSNGALHVTGDTGGDGVVSNGGTFVVQESGDSKIYLAALAGCVGGTELQVDLVNSAACTNAGTFAVQVDGDALTALQSIATATSGSAGSEGNLFNAVSVVAVNTSSATVDTSALGRVNILVKGSDLVVTTSFDVYVSGNGGVAWYYDSQIMMSTTDGAGNTLASRFGSLSLDVAGVNMVKLVAHGTETVTASLYGR